MYTVIENPDGLKEYSNFGRDLVLESLKTSLDSTICFYDYSTQKNDIFGGVSNVEESEFAKSMEALFECVP